MSKRILAIDPGCTESAWMILIDGEIYEFAKEPNEILLDRLISTEMTPDDHLAMEMIASYGMPVGKEVFETVLWAGRFIQAFRSDHTLVYRKDVKMHLCGSMRAKDANIRQALLDRFGPQGTKKAPGVTYGISKDVWAALAVAVTFADKQV
jgi:hypothetical protein